MERHVIDRPSGQDDGQRVRAFMRILKGNGSGSNPRQVHARGTERGGASRLRQFLRIARGGSA